MTEDEQPLVEVFYADPVDEDGNAIGTVTSFDVTSTLGPARATKIPHDEMALPPDAPVFKLPERGDDR